MGVAGSCPQVFFDNSTNCLNSEYNSTTKDTHHLEWNRDCSRIMYQLKGYGLKVVELTGQTTEMVYAQTNFDPSTQLKGFWFMDKWDLNIGVAMEGKFMVFNRSQSSKLHEQAIESGDILTTYSEMKRMFVVSTPKDVLVYSFACP